MSANPYAPTLEQQQANDEALRVALRILEELHGRPLTCRQKDMEVRAARLARHFTREAMKRGDL